MERTLPATWHPTIRWRVLADFAALAFLVLAWSFLQRFSPDAGDAHAYWMTRDAIVYGTAGTPDAYLYSPLFAQVIRPLTLLDWPTFLAVWMALQIAALVYLVRPIGAVLLLPLLAGEIITGNIGLFLGVAVALAIRHPAAWSFLLLTKVTPGVGLLYHGLRREWRPLAIAGATTALLVVASVALDPGAWRGWFGALTHSSSTPSAGVMVPLAVRLPLAGLLVGIGAWKGWRWTVIVAAAYAVPVLWSPYPSMLLGLVPLLQRHDVHAPFVRRGSRSHKAGVAEPVTAGPEVVVGP